jgi:pyruvate kinase-like protein
LVAFTQSGDTARRLARLHTRLPLLAFTPEPGVRNQLALSWGIEPFLVPQVQTTTPWWAWSTRRCCRVGATNPVTWSSWWPDRPRRRRVDQPHPRPPPRRRRPRLTTAALTQPRARVGRCQARGTSLRSCSLAEICRPRNSPDNTSCLHPGARRLCTHRINGLASGSRTSTPIVSPGDRANSPSVAVGSSRATDIISSMGDRIPWGRCGHGQLARPRRGGAVAGQRSVPVCGAADSLAGAADRSTRRSSSGDR